MDDNLEYEELEALLEASLEISAQLDLVYLLQTIIERAAAILRARGGGIYEYYPDRQELRVIADWGGKQSIRGNSLRVGEGMAGQVVQTGSAFCVDDYKTWPNRLPLEANLFGAVVAVPLRWQDRILGVLYVTDDAEGRVFSQKDIRLLSYLANQAAIAMENARLSADIYQRSVMLQGLHDASIDLTRSETIPRLLQSIVDRVMKLLNAKGSGVYLLDDSGKTLRSVAASGLAQKVLGKSFPVENSNIGRVAKTREPFKWDDYQTWPQRPPEFAALGLAAVAYAPIAWQDKSLGVISAHDTVEERAFSQQELDILTHLGNLAAVALENAHRLADLKGIFESIDHAIHAVDKRGRITMFNKQAEIILGYKAEEVMGRPIHFLYYDPQEAHILQQRLFNGRVTDYDLDGRGKDGQRIPIRLSASLLYDYEGKQAGSIGFYRDRRGIESEQRKIRQLNGLLTAGQAVTSELDLPRALETITASARDALSGADLITLYPYDPEKKQFDPNLVFKGDLKSVELARNIDDFASTCAQIMMFNDVCFADDTAADPTLASPFVKREGVVSSAGTALRIGDMVVGVMFFNYRRKHYFSEEEKDVIRILASQAAIAISNAQLFARVQRQAQRLDHLYSTSLDLTKHKAPEAILQSILNRAVELSQAQGGSIYLLDSSKKQLELVIEFGIIPTEERLQTLPKGTGVAWQVITSAEPSTVPNYQNWPNRVRPYDHYHLTTVAGAPICGQGEIMGVILVHDVVSGRSFTTEELNLIEGLGNLAASALIQAQLRERQKQEKKLLEEVAQLVGLSRDLVTTWGKILKGAMEVTGAKYGSIGLIDNFRGRLHSVVEVGIRKYELLIGQEGIQSLAVANKSSILAPNVKEEPWSLYYWAGTEDTMCELVVPIFRGGTDTILGLINLESPEADALDNNDKQLVESLTIYADIAVQNTQQYADLEKRRKQLDALHQSAQVIASSLDPRVVLQAILEEAVRLTNVHFASIQERKGDRLYFRAFHPERAKEELPVAIREYMRLSGPGLTVKVANSGKSILANDVSLWPEFVWPEFVSGSNKQTRAELAVPILAMNGGVWGVLNVESDQLGAFDEDDQKVLEDLGRLAFIALRNVETASQLSRTTAVAVMGALGANILHDISREINQIRLSSYILQQRTDLPAEAKEHLHAIDQGITRLTPPQLPERLTEAGLVQHRAEDTTALVDEALDSELSVLRQKYPWVSFEHDFNCSGIRVGLHEHWLRSLLRHFVSNAVHAIPREKKTRVVTIMSACQNSVIEVQVKDTGQGIPSDIEGRLFNWPIPPDKGRSGRGLLLVRFIVEQSGGEVELLENVIGQGTRFAFRLPIVGGYETTHLST